MGQVEIIWAIVAAIFIVIEVVTVTFLFIYFGVGALVAMIVAFAGANITWQLASFAVTGIVLMLLTRPVLKKLLESPNVATNVDLVTGKSGIVTITINNDSNTGQIRIGTEYWTARTPESAPAEVIEVGEHVLVDKVEGVTARVRRRDQAE